jgi:ADP-ribose pyrophosphatase YjhB (NUDIX family)
MMLQQAIKSLDELVPNPQNGLPEELFLFISRMTPLINVDLLIKDKQGRTLLTWRDDIFYGAAWHIPGGIIRYKEHAADRMQKCAAEEIGCPVEFEPVPLTIIETVADRRDRGHFISMLYRCRLNGNPDPARESGERPARGEWKWHNNCPRDLIAMQRRYAQFI